MQTPVPDQPGSSPKQKFQIPDRWIWQGRIAPAFWTTASLISLTINVILLIALIVLGQQLFGLKDLVENQLIGGLYDNFVKMEEASIVTTITVQDTIRVEDTMPVEFDLPLQQRTEVTLVENTQVRNATIYLNGQAVPLNLVLKKGTRLPIELNMVIPVRQTIPVVLEVPVSLQVPVDIALSATELSDPFTGLQEVVYPYQTLLQGLPSSQSDVPLCNSWAGVLCDIFLAPP